MKKELLESYVIYIRPRQAMKGEVISFLADTFFSPPKMYVKDSDISNSGIRGRIEMTSERDEAQVFFKHPHSVQDVYINCATISALTGARSGTEYLVKSDKGDK